MQIEVPYGLKGKVIVSKNDVENLYLDGKKLKAKKEYYEIELNGGKYRFYEK